MREARGAVWVNPVQTFGESDLESVENIGRDLAVLGEKADLFFDLIGFIDHVEAFAPSRWLRVMDLAQVKDGALRRVTHAQTAIFDHAPVAVLLAIFHLGAPL